MFHFLKKDIRLLRIWLLSTRSKAWPAYSDVVRLRVMKWKGYNLFYLLILFFILDIKKMNLCRTMWEITNRTPKTMPKISSSMSLLEVSEFFCCSQSICVEFEGIIVVFFCKTFNLPKKNKFYNRETQTKIHYSYSK